MRPPELLIKFGAALADALKGRAFRIGRLFARGGVRIGARLRQRGAGRPSSIEAPAATRAATRAATWAAARASALRESLGRAPRPLRIAGLAAAGLGLALAALAALNASGGRGNEIAARVGSGYEFFDQLALPPPAPGELPFPLARPRKLRYTESDAAALGPRTWRFDVEALRARRVAELESLYDTLP